MSCSPFDLKDYFFGELPIAERSATESHLASCPGCREELARLGDTRALLMSVPDEEPPRRIAFVSDKVFEPRWWQRLWTSGPQLGFAGAAVLAIAIVIHALVMRPVAVTAQIPGPAPVAALDTKAVQVEVERQVNARLQNVLAERDAQQMERVHELVNAKARQLDQRRKQDLVLVGEALDQVGRRNQQMTKRVMYGDE